MVGLSQIQRFREYLDSKGGRHRLLAEAAEKSGKVTLNKKYLKEVEFFPHHPVNTTLALHQKSQIGRTFFKEVQVAPPRMTEAVKLYAQNPEPKLVRNPLEKLIEVIERDWNSDIFHVDFHSSGKDSKLISGILMKLREKYGEGWIGDILFLCWEPDGAHFRKIMEWEEWKRNQYHVYREGIQIDYRSEIVAFNNIWRWVNDYSLPHLVAGTAIEDAKRRQLIPKDRDIQLITGVSAAGLGYDYDPVHTRTQFPNKIIEAVLTKNDYHSIYAAWAAVPCRETNWPLHDIGVVSSFTKDEDRIEALTQLSPTLRKLPRYPHKKGYRKPNWLNGPAGLAKNTRVKAAKNYNDSWYAREMKQHEIHIAPDLNFGLSHDMDRWWRNYVLASTCEHLINKGVRIII